MKYKDWLDEWLRNYVKISSKQRTFMCYSDIVRLHIIPVMGEYEMQDIAPMELQHFVSVLLQSGNKRTGLGLSANSVNGIITVIQNSLKTAYSVGLIEDYAADKIKRPKINESRVICFTVAEQQAIERGILSGNKPKLFGIVLCLYTGLRIGELLALTWSDIDLQKGMLSVTKTVYDVRDENGRFARITDTPKTETSQREIPLSTQIMGLLRELKKKSASEYVVASNRVPVSVRAYQRSFDRLLVCLNIPHKGFHALRHTFATRALECGMDVKTLSEILGHKNPAVTLNRYVHSLMEHKRDMMNRLGKIFSPVYKK